MPTLKTQEHAAVEKPQIKPGRKLTTSEPKNKRTAQNRAAQRAFRERKEKRMKELEDKVEELEREKRQIANESELLRSQVSTLMKQLNGGSGNLGVSSTIGSTNSNMTTPYEEKMFGVNNPINTNSIQEYPLSYDDTTSTTSRSRIHISSNSSISSATPVSYSGDDYLNITPLDNNKTETDLSLKNKLNNQDFKDHYDEQIFCNELGQACGSKGCPMPKAKSNISSVASSKSSPLGLTNAVSVQTESSQTNSLFGGSVANEDDYLSGILTDGKSMKSTPRNDWNFGIEPFGITNTNANSKTNEMDFLFNDDSIKLQTDKLIENNAEAFQIDPTSELFADYQMNEFDFDFNDNNDDNDNNDGLFDDLLKLPEETKVVEERAAIPAGGSYNAADSVTSEDEEVPDNTKGLIECSQIWERITTHPRFTELDIDNLCEELKQKAKCSESGVVVDGNDVGKLLHKAISEKEQAHQNARDFEIKKLALASAGPNSFLQGMW